MKYIPENVCDITANINAEFLKNAMENKVLICAKVLLYRPEEGLILNLGGFRAIIPKDMAEYSQTGHPIKEAALITKVNKKVCFYITDIKEENGQVSYNSSVEEQMNSIESGNTTVSIDSGQTGDGRDPYFADAAKLLIDKEKGSIGMLQRYFKVGFNRAARIMDQLEEAGIVGPEEGTKPRKVLMSPEQFEQYEEEYL